MGVNGDVCMYVERRMWVETDVSGGEARMNCGTKDELTPEAAPFLTSHS